MLRAGRVGGFSTMQANFGEFGSALCSSLALGDCNQSRLVLSVEIEVPWAWESQKEASVCSGVKCVCSLLVLICHVITHSFQWSQWQPSKNQVVLSLNDSLDSQQNIWMQHVLWIPETRHGRALKNYLFAIGTKHWNSAQSRRPVETICITSIPNQSGALRTTKRLNHFTFLYGPGR